MSSKDAASSTLLSYFSPIHVVKPGVRRKLDTPVAAPRKKALTAGRTNPLECGSSSGKQEKLRRLRPHSIATTKFLKRHPVVATPGSRESRDEALTVEDLWRPGPGPIQFFTFAATVIATLVPGSGLSSNGLVRTAKR
ncbi:hypothetical protein C8F04DRAFT_1252906 [Mycena alexandri]|uniref:Uncharacterized protein n=1 Tax=Mycena alexandri TaxID=1745969 RepID=A0AAD6SL13_9AGAR|nr:hypothetical protein C8F04DRAFT_1277924 [Mycena alexandri]KAJ7026060.1 hypothetical protein C8F04DRAFT_1268531 [Mycena alexandri]KAJ7028045.1 hypothetical protein C8F04DRAFT_1266441 [Mycena alexandri]KAJ7041589.1 hypothetical protein C8F04DRAFT_1252906 [Mycena alexandri]